MGYYFSNEIVFAGHPDKVCDQISDAILDAYMSQDKESRCGIETVGGKGKIFITGEVTSNVKVDVEKVVKETLKDVGYKTDYKVINNIGQQSPDIAQGVDNGGAGDQGMMFGYACRDTPYMLPTAMVILQEFSRQYDMLRRIDHRFLPDGKAQITGWYEDGKLKYIRDFTISYQNTEIERKETDSILIKMAMKIAEKYDIYSIDCFHVNPTGKFLIGGFDGDAGLTGRKIVVDCYHSFANVGGGAFSGKDATKVDRSAAYKARQIAIECLTEKPDINWCEVQLSYAIGIEQPLAIYIKTDKGIYDNVSWLYAECAPQSIIEDLDLKNVKYYKTAKYGHFGNQEFNWEKGLREYESCNRT